MDWITLLKSMQGDFIGRLESGTAWIERLNGNEINCFYSEVRYLRGDRLQQIRDFCWQMAEKYKKNANVRDAFLNNMKGKLGEEMIKTTLGNVVTDVDYENRFGGDGKVDFSLRNNSAVRIQVKTRQIPIRTTRISQDLGGGEIRDVEAKDVVWFVSPEEISKNTAIVCVGIVGDVDEAQKEYYLINAGFLPCSMIEVDQKTIKLKMHDLLYSFGLKNYLESL